MNLPDNTNPTFLAWLSHQSNEAVEDINAHWKTTETTAGLFRGHRSEDHARLRFLIDYCRATHGYAG
jgi:hypothetical protein